MSTIKILLVLTKKSIPNNAMVASHLHGYTGAGINRLYYFTYFKVCAKCILVIEQQPNATWQSFFRISDILQFISRTFTRVKFLRNKLWEMGKIFAVWCLIYRCSPLHSYLLHSLVETFVANNNYSSVLLKHN